MFYKTKISPKLISLVFGILVVCFAITFYVFAAWDQPDNNPPQDNITSPLNSGIVGQSKSGGLLFNTGGAEYGLIVDQGRLGIGTASPLEVLDLGSGNFTTTGGIMTGYIQADEYRSSFGNQGATFNVYFDAVGWVPVNAPDPRCKMDFENGLLVSSYLCGPPGW